MIARYQNKEFIDLFTDLAMANTDELEFSLQNDIQCLLHLGVEFKLQHREMPDITIKNWMDTARIFREKAQVSLRMTDKAVCANQV